MFGIRTPPKGKSPPPTLSRASKQAAADKILQSARAALEMAEEPAKASQTTGKPSHAPSTSTLTAKRAPQAAKSASQTSSGTSLPVVSRPPRGLDAPSSSQSPPLSPSSLAFDDLLHASQRSPSTPPPSQSASEGRPSTPNVQRIEDVTREVIDLATGTEVFENRVLEAKNCLLKAKLQLKNSRNTKTEIKNEVVKAVERLYQLVKECGITVEVEAERGCLCVVCGARADCCCARCGLTPYCSARCQRRDWPDRHRAVCHNLARLAGKTDVPSPVKSDVSIPAKAEPPEPVVEKEIFPPPAPLRRPHSPANTNPRRDNDLPELTSPKKTTPTQNNKQQTRSFNHGPRNFSNNNQTNKQDRSGDRKPMRQDNGEEQEDRRANAKKTSPALKVLQPKPPSELVDSTPASRPQPVEPRPVSSEPRPHPVPSKPEAKLAKPAMAPGSVMDVTPSKIVKKLVPKNYLLELLSIDDVAILTVEATGEACKSEKPGLVCLSMHARFEGMYQELFEVFTTICNAENKAITPSPGESFAYFNSSDGSWYRARRLSRAAAALLDASKVVALRPGDKLQPLPDKHDAAPEFCCLLNAEGVKIGDSLICTLISKTADGFKVSLEDALTGESKGEGEVSRWLPAVEYSMPPTPEPTEEEKIKPVQPTIPEIRRPDVVNNSKVVLVDATAIDRVFVRPSDAAAQRRFDQTLQDVILFGRDASPLKEPPTKGQIVIGKFTDGLFYRALCKRTNVKQNKYLLEYIEFGNTEVVPLENIYPCPPLLDLNTQPTEVSQVTLQCKYNNAFTLPAVAYLDTLKDKMIELTLTLPLGTQTAASGSAVFLTEVVRNESVNKKVEQMCTPEWKKMEERGVDVVETEPLMYSDLECLELPANGCELDILDISALEAGSVCGCQRGLPHQKHVRERLTKQMEEYCNSEIGREPYLPKFEELCIARCPPYPQWFRAVLLEQNLASPGARVCYVDYGNVEDVSVNLLRKMLPEFVRGLPALASHLEIKDFPEEVTQEMLVRAVEYMKIDDEGRGTLSVTRCVKQDSGLYLVHAPDLIKAMLGQ